VTEREDGGNIGHEILSLPITGVKKVIILFNSLLSKMLTFFFARLYLRLVVKFSSTISEKNETNKKNTMFTFLSVIQC